MLQLSKHSNKKFRIIYNPVEAVKVLSFDLSFSYSAAVKLFRRFSDAQVLDHHKTTNEECFGKHAKNLEIFSNQLHFDNSGSGAALAFQFFFTDGKMPKLVEYVWTWKLPDSKAISAGIYRHLSMYI